MMTKQLGRFGGIGLLAAAVHYLTALLLMHWACPPLLANLFAFLTAFMVSYTGHRSYTFEVSDLDHRQTLPRFFLVASTGFGLNESLFWAALRYTRLPPDVSLGVIILIVAACTFVLSRRFAFSRR